MPLSKVSQLLYYQATGPRNGEKPAYQKIQPLSKEPPPHHRTTVIVLSQLMPTTKRLILSNPNG